MPALVPVFNPAALGLTSGRVVGFNGTTFTNTLATFASSGNLLSVTAGVATDIPLLLKGAVSQSGNLLELRNSGNTLLTQTTSNGTWNFKDTSGNTRIIVGASDGTAGVIHSRAVHIRDTTGASNTRLQLDWDNSFIRGVSGAILCWSSNANDASAAAQDTGLLRYSAGIVGLYDGDQTGNPGLQMIAKSATVNRRERLSIITSAVDNVDVSRKYRTIFNIYDTAAREALRLEASGTAAMIGFLGAAAIVRPTVTGSRGGNAALASVLTELSNLGLIVDSSTV